VARPVLVDAGVAALCVLVFWLPWHDQPHCPLPVHVTLPVALTAGLAVRSRQPVVSFWLVTASTLVGTVLGVTSDPFAAAAWTLCSVAAARRGPRVSSTVSVLLGISVVALVMVGGPDLPTTRSVLLSLLLLAGANPLCDTRSARQRRSMRASGSSRTARSA
jgi:hypothetical protein